MTEEELEALHETLAARLGWTLRDPYEDLPEAQKMKDSIFVSVVRAVLKAGGV